MEIFRHGVSVVAPVIRADDITEMNVADLRKDYLAGALEREDLADDAIEQFRLWFAEATADPRIIEANAMTLSTADPEVGVTSRIVLLKGLGPDGFRFFTNYESGKGRQIAADARVALSFYWQGLERQIHITGRAEKLPREVSESYFRSRPRESRLGAWASQQSRVVASREALEAAHERVSKEYPGDEIPMPLYWGGYLVRPQTVEFWQGRTGRLHDRFRFIRGGDFGWKVDRLEP
jgi:pyridoxamine 5'-phosphate oxidase